MRIELETPNTTSSLLKVKVQAQDMDSLRQRLIRELSANLKISGFRPGKAPQEVAARAIGDKRLQEAFLNQFLPEAARQALEKHKIHPVISPKITLSKFVPFDQLEFKIEAQHLGKTEFADYSKIRKEMPEVKAGQQELDDVLEKIRLDFAQYKEVKRPSKEGDRVWVDFVGYDSKGKEMPGIRANNYPVRLGSKSLIKGFEEKIVGNTAPKKLSFKLTFPEDAPAGLAGSKADFKVELHKVEDVKVPKIDNALAAKVGPFKTVSELKKFIKERTLQEKRARTKEMYSGHLVATLAQKSKIELPQELIDAEINKLRQERDDMLAKQGLSLEQWLQQTGIDQKKHQSNMQQTAVNSLKGGLVLREVARSEKIEISDQEIEAVWKQQGSMAQNQEMSDKDKHGIKTRLTVRKALDRLSQIAQQPKK